MSIVLTESPDSGQATQGSRDFISVENTEICESDWQFFVGSLLVSEHQAMGWAVHWLDSITLVLSFEQEDVFGVLFVVTRSLPQLQVENIWGNDFLETSNSVLLSDEIHEPVVNMSTFWIHERTTWRKLMDIKESLGSSNCSVISFGCLLSVVDVLVHFGFAWESNTINSLKTIIFSVSKPVS